MIKYIFGFGIVLAFCVGGWIAVYYAIVKHMELVTETIIGLGALK